MKIGKLDEYAVKTRVFAAFFVLLSRGICVPLGRPAQHCGDPATHPAMSASF